MREAPIYFSGPDDIVETVDPYEVFEIPPETETENPEDNVVDNEEIVTDDPNEPLTTKDVIERSGESLPKEAESITKLGEDVVEDIVSDVNEAISEPKDYFHDLNGVKHTKDQFLEFSDLTDLIKSIEDIFGILCVDGVFDHDFKNPYTGNVIKDLLNKGLFSFADCFLAEGVTTGTFVNMTESILSGGGSILSSDGFSTVEWIDDKLDPGSLSLFDDDFTNDLVGGYVRPPSSTSGIDELKRIEDTLDKTNDDWFKPGDLLRDESNIEHRLLDVIKNSSNDVRDVLEYSDGYIESLAVTEAYEREIEFRNYPLI